MKATRTSNDFFFNHCFISSLQCRLYLPTIQLKRTTHQTHTTSKVDFMENHPKSCTVCAVASSITQRHRQSSMILCSASKYSCIFLHSQFYPFWRDPQHHWLRCSPKSRDSLHLVLQMSAHAHVAPLSWPLLNIETIWTQIWLFMTRLQPTVDGLWLSCVAVGSGGGARRLSEGTDCVIVRSLF